MLSNKTTGPKQENQTKGMTQLDLAKWVDLGQQKKHGFINKQTTVISSLVRFNQGYKTLPY
jgi:hypothetical protein